MAKVSHSSRGHSDLPPSSSDKWTICWGWMATVGQHRAKYGRPPSSKAAEEGTRAHEKFELHLRADPRLAQPVKKQGFQLLTEDDDEYEDLLPMLEWLEEQPGDLYLETRIDFGEEFGYVGLTGTLDIALVSEECLHIVDLKYGRQVVEAVNKAGRPNSQLMTYLMGAIQAFGPRPSYRLTILQPRAWHREGPIRSVDVAPAGVEVFHFELEEAIEANYAGGPCRVGPHCRHYCEALSSCKAVRMHNRQRLLAPLE